MLFTQHYLDEAWFLQAYILNCVRNTRHVCCFLELLAILVFLAKFTFWVITPFGSVLQMFLECANQEITAILKFQEQVWFMLLCVSFYRRCYYVLIPVICSWIWINYHVGRTRSSVSNWEARDQSPSHEEPTTSSSSLAPTGRPYSSVCLKQAINLLYILLLHLFLLISEGCENVGQLSLKILCLLYYLISFILVAAAVPLIHVHAS